MPKGVPQVGGFGVLHHFFGQLRRDEEDSTIPPQHHVARHHGRMPDPRGTIDADHRRVETRSGGQRPEVMRRIVVANKGDEVRQFVEAVDVADRAVVTIPLPELYAFESRLDP